VDAHGAPFRSELGGDARQSLEPRHEFRAAIRIAGIIERVDADEQILRSRRFRPGEREEKNKVAGT
jgi:hypothetical protein